MEQASGILQRIMADAVAQTLKHLPPEELPQAAWEYAAGPAVAEKTRVLGCEAQTLRVEVADANWRAQLEAMAPQYVARLRPYLGVERIEFEIAGRSRCESRSETKIKRQSQQPHSSRRKA